MLSSAVSAGALQALTSLSQGLSRDRECKDGPHLCAWCTYGHCGWAVAPHAASNISIGAHITQ